MQLYVCRVRTLSSQCMNTDVYYYYCLLQILCVIFCKKEQLQATTNWRYIHRNMSCFTFGVSAHWMAYHVEFEQMHNSYINIEEWTSTTQEQLIIQCIVFTICQVILKTKLVTSRTLLETQIPSYVYISSKHKEVKLQVYIQYS